MYAICFVPLSFMESGCVHVTLPRLPFIETIEFSGDGREALTTGMTSTYLLGICDSLDLGVAPEA